MTGYRQQLTTGSPPLTRGILCFCCWQMYSHRVHPRSRGEYVFYPLHSDVYVGSPPLTRGILRCTRFRLLLIRVHPRSRGKYRLSRSACNRFLGSPPLTRGIHKSLCSFIHLSGFTPAHAGNTSLTLWFCTHCWVHPRSRGEYSSWVNGYSRVLGSPPLTRGIRSSISVPRTISRFTPAHAGNTLKKALFYLTFSNTHFHISFNF